MERKNWYVREGPFGDSLFAKRDFSKGELIGYYTGFWYVENEINWSNMTDSEQWDFHKNLIRLEDNLDINVPKDYWNITKYKATLGHKVNHSFIKTNTVYGNAYNPRFGKCICHIATKNIKKYEELWTNYHYEDGDDVPEWYKEVRKIELGKEFGVKKRAERADRIDRGR